jgi:HPt (histidine-containing phosphotransfer) domain-containing protein
MSSLQCKSLVNTMVEAITNRAIANISDLRNNCPEYVNAQILDIDIFQGLRESIGDDLLFSDLVTIYLGSAEDLIDAIQVAFTAQNATAFSIASHTLKSTSSSIGAIKLSQIGRYFEKIGKTGEITIAPELLDLLINEYDRAIAEIRLFVLKSMAE